MALVKTRDNGGYAFRHLNWRHYNGETSLQSLESQQLQSFVSDAAAYNAGLVSGQWYKAANGHWSGAVKGTVIELE